MIFKTVWYCFQLLQFCCIFFLSFWLGARGGGGSPTSPRAHWKKTACAAASRSLNACMHICIYISLQTYACVHIHQPTNLCVYAFISAHVHKPPGQTTQRPIERIIHIQRHRVHETENGSERKRPRERERASEQERERDSGRLPYIQRPRGQGVEAGIVLWSTATLSFPYNSIPCKYL